MKPKTILMTLVVLFAGAAVCLAADSNMGTWKLNEAKSKIGAGMTKNVTVVWEMVGDKVKVTVDGIDSDGKPVHTEWTGSIDGKDYPIVGDATTDSRSFKKVDANTTELTAKKGGKTLTTGRIVVSPDGKTRTVTTSGTNPKGAKVSSTAVYDKQ